MLLVYHDQEWSAISLQSPRSVFDSASTLTCETACRVRRRVYATVCALRLLPPPLPAPEPLSFGIAASIPHLLWRGGGGNMWMQLESKFFLDWREKMEEICTVLSGVHGWALHIGRRGRESAAGSGVSAQVGASGEADCKPVFDSRCFEHSN